MTQGRNGCCHQWVKKYRVQYSMDCSNNSNSWHPIGDHTVNDTVSILPDLRSKIFKLQGKIHQIQNLISIQVTALHEAMVLSFCKQSWFHKINQVFPSVGVVTYIQCVDSFWKIE